MLKPKNDSFQVGAAPEDKEEFRNRINSIKETGGRNWVFAKKPSGNYTRAREIVAFVLLTFFFTAPFIKINGHPFLLLNLIERKFVIFGTAFWPSDFHLLAIGGLTLLVTIVIFTAIYGRVWCGWACPQTIFMEMVFRKIEYWIEGDRSAQIRLDNQEWNREKMLKKGLKHGVFFTLSFVIANLFLSYIIGVEELWKIISDPVSKHWVGLFSITLFSIVFYSVFARFREQVCHFACPYGRYQSVMVNEDSICVTYDFKRGEDRANQKVRVQAQKKHEVDIMALAQGESLSESKAFGDCIDCEECVRVCPMGIDIRNGIQLECVHCTACIDACDSIMTKIGKPKELIRYASYNQIKEDKKSIFTTRVKAYSSVLVVLMSLFVYLLTTRTEVEAIITRVPGILFAKVDDNTTSNLFSYKLVNKTFIDKEIELKIISPVSALLKPFGDFPTVPHQEIAEGRFMIFLPNAEMEKGRAAIKLGLYVDDEFVEEMTTQFTGPRD